VRLREMSVLVRDLDVYHDLIAASFREHEIEFFADRRRQVGHHPLLQFIRACLSIALLSWPHDAVMTVIKSGPRGYPIRMPMTWKTTCWSIACAAQPGQRKSPGTTPAKCSSPRMNHQPNHCGPIASTRCGGNWRPNLPHSSKRYPPKI